MLIKLVRCCTRPHAYHSSRSSPIVPPIKFAALFGESFRALHSADQRRCITHLARKGVLRFHSRLPMATDHAESNGLHERFGLTSNIDREADGRPMLQADEELFGTFPGVSLLLGGSSQGDGTLYVSTRSAISLPPVPPLTPQQALAASGRRKRNRQSLL